MTRPTAVKRRPPQGLGLVSELPPRCFSRLGSCCSPCGRGVPALPARPAHRQSPSPPPTPTDIHVCLPSQFKCTNTNRCIPGIFRCNGQDNCGDGDDERDCRECPGRWQGRGCWRTGTETRFASKSSPCFF